jgi:hypothetical protein
LASMMELRCFVVTSAASGLVPSSTDNGSCKTSGVMFFSALASVRMVSICLRRSDPPSGARMKWPANSSSS